MMDSLHLLTPPLQKPGLNSSSTITTSSSLTSKPAIGLKCFDSSSLPLTHVSQDVEDLSGDFFSVSASVGIPIASPESSDFDLDIFPSPPVSGYDADEIMSLVNPVMPPAAKVAYMPRATIALPQTPLPKQCSASASNVETTTSFSNASELDSTQAPVLKIFNTGLTPQNDSSSSFLSNALTIRAAQTEAVPSSQHDHKKIIMVAKKPSSPLSSAKQPVSAFGASSNHSGTMSSAYSQPQYQQSFDSYSSHTPSSSSKLHQALTAPLPSSRSISTQSNSQTVSYQNQSHFYSAPPNVVVSKSSMTNSMSSHPVKNSSVDCSNCGQELSSRCLMQTCIPRGPEVNSEVTCRRCGLELTTKCILSMCVPKNM